MKFSTKQLFAALGLVAVISVAPNSAVANDGVYISTPGLTIGYHGGKSYKRSRKSYRKRSYNNYNNSYNNNGYYNNRRSNNYYSNGRSYNRNSYNRGYDNSYKNKSYRNNNYRSNSYRGNGYRSGACPIDGYSQYYDRGSDCYEHKDHYHCS